MTERVLSDGFLAKLMTADNLHPGLSSSAKLKVTMLFLSCIHPCLRAAIWLLLLSVSEEGGDAPHGNKQIIGLGNVYAGGGTFGLFSVENTKFTRWNRLLHTLTLTSRFPVY